MRACIQNSFANDGFFTLMRSPEMQLAAQSHVAHHAEVPGEEVPGEEVPGDIEELGAQSGTDTDTDSDSE